jgi:hypothetical protein
VSNELPDDTVVRGVIECPDCIRENLTSDRAECENLLQQVPDSGIAETLASLQQIREFWVERDAQQQVQRETEQATQSVQAIVTHRTKATTYPISEDESC